MQAGMVQLPVCSFASCTETGKIVEDTATGTPKLITLQSNVTGNIWGSWVELDASLSVDSWLSSVTVFNSFVAARQVLELGIGSAGNEVTIARWSFKLVYLSAVGIITSLVLPVPIPIKMLSGTRIAMKIADDNGAVNDYPASAQYYQGLET